MVFLIFFNKRLIPIISKARLDMDSEYKPYSINVYPPIDVINKAFMDVMFFLNWTKVAIIYEEDQGLLLLPAPILTLRNLQLDSITCYEI